MADLREIPPGTPPWAVAPDPWWVWAVRGALTAAVVVFTVSVLAGAVIKVAQVIGS